MSLLLAETPLPPFAVAGLVVGAVVFGVGLWVAVVALTGAVGWRPTLARRFPAARWPAPGEGVRLGMQSAQIGLASYRGALTAVLADDGLYLRPVKVFAVNHPPVCIPWGAVEGVEAGWWGAATVRLAGGGGFTTWGGLARRLRERSGVA